MNRWSPENQSEVETSSLDDKMTTKLRKTQVIANRFEANGHSILSNRIALKGSRAC
jgi:hypothetical protein